MLRRIAPALLALPLVLACAGPSKLAQRSEEKLAGGDAWRAWQLATKALDREPGNSRARQAAAAAGTMIVSDWQRRIHSLAAVDSLQAADQVLELDDFRVQATRYAALPIDETADREAHALRRAAARMHYQRGLTARDSHRPKAAYLHFADAERFVPDYRDAARLADQAWSKALTRVALVPFRTGSDVAIGREAAD